MSSTPEYLEGPAGRPLPPAERRSRRTPWVVGGAAVAVAVLGGGAWAAWSFFSTGSQPAEALPASTIAYASVDLDPSGAQKIDALRTLRKFPAFKDKIGMDTGDDVRQRIFEELQGSGTCPDLDYQADIEPWLGDRMAVAAVDTGADDPAPVFVLQVTDEGAADKGLSKLRDCASSGTGSGTGSDTGAWTIHDGWALVGESQDVVDGIADDATDATLADDSDYQHWTGLAGDGIATVYVSPKAGPFIAKAVGQLQGLGLPSPSAAADAASATRDVGGFAATLKFDSGGLELAAVGHPNDQLATLFRAGGGGDAVQDLPAGTAIAVGAGFGDHWLQQYLDRLGSTVEDQVGMSVDRLLAEGSRASGLDLPQDIETLLGDSTGLAVSGDLDLEKANGPEDLPVALRIHGDAARIQAVLDKLRPKLGAEASILGSDVDGDTVVVGPDADYRGQVLEGGALGDTAKFKDVVPQADDATYVVFADLDAADGFLDQFARHEPDSAQVVDNVRPLDAIGFSTWVDGDVGHVLLKITTD